MLLAEKLSNLGVVLPSWALNSWAARTGGGATPTLSAGAEFTATWHVAWPTDPAIHARWESLLARCPELATPFHAPAFQSALAKPYARAGRLRLLTLYRTSTGGDANELVGVLPLWIAASNELRCLGNGACDYLDPLIDPQSRRVAWKYIIAALEHVPGMTDRPRLVLDGMRSASFDLVELGSAAEGTGCTISAEPTDGTAQIALSGTWEDYLATLPGRDRKELKRKIKNAQARAGARLRIASSEHEVLPALERVFEFIRQAGGRRGLKAQWTYRPLFKRSAAELTRAGRLEVHMLELEGRDAAGTIVFPTKNGPLFWAVGYEHTLAQHSPGIVLFGLSIQNAIERGAKVYDLLRGQQRYKSELGATESPVWRLVLQRQ